MLILQRILARNDQVALKELPTMPNPHFSMSIISGGGKSTIAAAAYQSGNSLTQKGNGQSVIATAAYHSGEVLYDAKNEKTFDYRYKRTEDLIHTEIIAPADAPEWAKDRGKLWHQVQAREQGKNFRLARTIIAGLPRELSHEQNLALVRGFVQENFTSKKLVADFAIHESEAADGYKNPHVHIMFTVRGVNQDGFLKAKERSLDRKNTLHGWRDAWEKHTNKQLELAGRPERVSLKSYEEQGKNKIPQIHIGVEANLLEKQGIETKRGNYNRKVRRDNIITQVLEWKAVELDQDNQRESLDVEGPAPENQPAKGQIQHVADFLGTDPTMRLEAMTLELKDDIDEYADQKSESGSQKSEQIGVHGKEGVLGVFRNQDEDTRDLAVASLETSRVLNEAVLAYLESPEHQRSQKQVIEKVRLAEYHRRTEERFKALVAGQIRPLSRETEQTRQQKERSDELER